MLLGVEEPKCLIHAPNESVDPSEIENLAHAEALFLQRYAQSRASPAPLRRRRPVQPPAAAMREIGRWASNSASTTSA